MLKSINIKKFCTETFFRRGCFSTTVKKKQYLVVLNNRRQLLLVSHKQRNTAEFLRRIPFRVGPPEILRKETPQEIKKICKQARPHRPSCKYLADSARKSTRCLQETKSHSARVPTSIRMPTCSIFVPFPLKTGTNLIHPLPPSIVERVWPVHGIQCCTRLTTSAVEHSLQHSITVCTQ